MFNGDAHIIAILALGFIAYPVIKLLGGRARELRWPMVVTPAVMLAYILLLRGGL